MLLLCLASPVKKTSVPAGWALKFSGQPPEGRKCLPRDEGGASSGAPTNSCISPGLALRGQQLMPSRILVAPGGPLFRSAPWPRPGLGFGSFAGPQGPRGGQPSWPSNRAGAVFLRATPPTPTSLLAAPEMHHQASQWDPGDHPPEPHLQRDPD